MGTPLYPWREAFLEALRQVPVVARACEAAGIDRPTAYRRRQADKDFAEAWDDALETGVDRAEAEAFRRGMVGFEEPVIHQGVLTYLYERDARGDVIYDTVQREEPDLEKGGMRVRDVRVPRLLLDARGQPVPLTIRKHSDALLSLVLKGRRKSVYADRTELTGANGGPVQQARVIVATGVPVADDDEIA